MPFYMSYRNNVKEPSSHYVFVALSSYFLNPVLVTAFSTDFVAEILPIFFAFTQE